MASETKPNLALPIDPHTGSVAMPPVTATPVSSPRAAADAMPPVTTTLAKLQRVAATSGLICLSLALLTFLLCIGVLASYLVVTLQNPGTIQFPGAAGSKEDAAKWNASVTAEHYRQQARPEQRTSVLRACALLAGVAVASLALTLFFGAVRMELEKADAPVPAIERSGTPSTSGTSSVVEKPERAFTFSGRLAPFIPAIVALVCATCIIVTSTSESRPAVPQTSYAYPVSPQFALPMTASSAVAE